MRNLVSRGADTFDEREELQFSPVLLYDILYKKSFAAFLFDINRRIVPDIEEFRSLYLLELLNHKMAKKFFKNFYKSVEVFFLKFQFFLINKILLPDGITRNWISKRGIQLLQLSF